MSSVQAEAPDAWYSECPEYPDARYWCTRCKHPVLPAHTSTGRYQCQNCGHGVVSKHRSPVVRRVLAR